MWLYFIIFWDSGHVHLARNTAFDKESDFHIKNKQVLEPSQEGQNRKNLPKKKTNMHLIALDFYPFIGLFSVLGAALDKP